MTDSIETPESMAEEPRMLRLPVVEMAAEPAPPAVAAGYEPHPVGTGEHIRFLERVNAELVERMQAFADRQYCLGIEMLQRQECLGWEAKVKAGKFGQAHLDAHVQAGRHFGAHFGIYEAIKAARAALTSATKEQQK